MEDEEQRALSMFPTPPRFWKHYVDDTCTALHPDHFPAFHRRLNSIEASIQFYPEENGKLAFLDTVSHVMKTLKWNGYPKSAFKMSYPQRQQANTNNEAPVLTVT